VTHKLLYHEYSFIIPTHLNYTAKCLLNPKLHVVNTPQKQLQWSLSCIRLDTPLQRYRPKVTSRNPRLPRRADLHPDQPYRKVRQTGRPPILDERAERRLIRFVANNPFEALESLSTPSPMSAHLNWVWIAHLHGFAVQRARHMNRSILSLLSSQDSQVRAFGVVFQQI